jgi:hypothetical protein
MSNMRVRGRNNADQLDQRAIERRTRYRVQPEVPGREEVA